jgi:hypothetical protein
MGNRTWSQNASERFWSKVDKGGECWEWIGSIGGHGYGTFYAGPKTYVPAHRFAYVTTYGEIPTSIHVDHICRNRRCVNPKHLRAATHKQNIENHNGARRNSKSGIRGVYRDETRRKWCASVTHNRRQFTKRFDRLADAKAWVIQTRIALHTHNEADRQTA